MKYLYQKSLLKEKYFEITRKGLKIKEKSITKKIEFMINFEDITSQTKVFESKKIIWKLLSFISLLKFLIQSYKGMNRESIFSPLEILPISLLSIILFMFIYYYTVEKYIMLICSDGTGIAFFKKHSTEEQVRHFITIILEHRNEYMKNKYGNVDYDLPYENQVGTFNYLRDEKIITSEEYEELKRKLKY